MGKQKIRFQAKHITGRLYLLPGCDKARILHRLMGRNMETYELSLLSDMGFDVEIGGENIEDASELLEFFKG